MKINRQGNERKYLCFLSTINIFHSYYMSYLYPLLCGTVHTIQIEMIPRRSKFLPSCKISFILIECYRETF